ncbi:actin-related protein 6-like [Prunus persica]|uniref:actin-related protein 6-like n=1 Tax=Prunus persica TaxID=3760 RepID=UPI0009AB4B60|nr:actin-related protein 6-like [Prunus persica]
MIFAHSFGNSTISYKAKALTWTCFARMNQAGLVECIVLAVSSCHLHLHPVLHESDLPNSAFYLKEKKIYCQYLPLCLNVLASIILTGGSTLFPRLADRLERELRPLDITPQQDPMLGVWRGGSLFRHLWPVTI